MPYSEKMCEKNDGKDFHVIVVFTLDFILLLL